MCQGSNIKKAEILFEIIHGKNERKIHKDSILTYHNLKLEKVMKNLVFFSEIFPKKYNSKFSESFNIPIKESESLYSDYGS